MVVEVVEVQCRPSTSTPPHLLYCRVRWAASTDREEALVLAR